MARCSKRLRAAIIRLVPRGRNCAPPSPVPRCAAGHSCHRPGDRRGSTGRGRIPGGEAAAVGADEAAGVRRLREAAALLRAECGPVRPRVRFSAQAGSSACSSRDGSDVALDRPARRAREDSRCGSASSAQTRVALIAGARREPARVNYLLGERPRQVAHDLRTYEGSSTAALAGRGPPCSRGERKLKYEFLVARGGASRVRLAYRGPKRLSLGTQGNLRFDIARRLPMPAPTSYQLSPASA